MLGISALRAEPERVRGRRVGLITNHTGLDIDFRPTAEVLVELGADLRALFGPEHGVDGALQDADFVDNIVMHVPGAGEVPVYSVYRSDGDVGIPAGSLDGLDLLIFDIADVGARYYTYPTTLGLAMADAAEAGIPFMVLDRPNPIGGRIEGPWLDDDCRSFVGYYDVPVRHGLTLGEEARYINEHYLAGKCSLEVIRAPGWRRDMTWPATGLSWIFPSPNVPTYDTAVVYPGTCLFEGTEISEGRGTTRPFELIGAPWIDPREYADHLNGLGLPGVRFRATWFIPAFDRHAGLNCGGVQVHVTDEAALLPVKTGLAMVVAARRLYPDGFGWREPPTPGGLQHFDRLIGSKRVRAEIEAGASLDELMRDWESYERDFKARAADLLLYP